MTKTALFFSPSIKIKHCKTSTRQVYSSLLPSPRRRGRRRRRRRSCFGQQSHWQKKYPFFVPYVVVCFDPIAANGIDVIHGCGGQQGGDVGKPRKCEKFCPRNPFWPKFANTSLNLPLDDGKLGTTFETGGESLMKQKKAVYNILEHCPILEH